MRNPLLGILLASATIAYGFQPPRIPRPKPYETGWESLFNNKDLTGWVKVGHEKWEVEDGAIHGQGITKEYGYLRIVEGNHYIAWLNGVKIVDFTDPTPKSFDGYIALQLHSGGLGNMRFKDLSIRDLSHR